MNGACHFCTIVMSLTLAVLRLEDTLCFAAGNEGDWAGHFNFLKSSNFTCLANFETFLDACWMRGQEKNGSILILPFLVQLFGALLICTTCVAAFLCSLKRTSSLFHLYKLSFLTCISIYQLQFHVTNFIFFKENVHQTIAWATETLPTYFPEVTYISEAEWTHS